MYRIKMESPNCPTAYKWYNDAKAAHLVAITIIRNRDYQKVSVENLKAGKVERVYTVA